MNDNDNDLPAAGGELAEGQVLDAGDAVPVTPVQRPAPDRATLKRILEGALLAAGETLDIERFGTLFEDYERPDEATLRELLAELSADYEGRGIELKEVASGFRIQVRRDLGHWVSRLWTEKAPRYSRALLETMALIAYRQPITRGEIEEIRGVSVSSEMVKSLMERDWIRVVGHRDVPGRPAMYATTRDFLDYFDLRSLEDLPTLSDIRDLDKVNEELQLDAPAPAAVADEPAPAGAPQYLALSEQEPQGDDLDIGMDMAQVDEVLKRVEDSFRRRDAGEDEAAGDGADTTGGSGSPSPA